MRVQYAATIDGKLITVSAEIYFTTLNNSTTFYGNGLVINCYNTDLKQLFQRIMPVSYSASTLQTTGYILDTNGLKIVSNSDSLAIFGQLDLSIGKWLKLTSLSSNGGYSDQHVIWLNDKFIVLYKRSRLLGRKYNIDLVLNSY